MKTYNHLFDAICSFENLMAAARAAERGRRLNDHVGRFRTRMEAEVLRLREELTTGTYQPGSYREFWIREPKERMISAAPYTASLVRPRSPAKGFIATQDAEIGNPILRICCPE